MNNPDEVPAVPPEVANRRPGALTSYAAALDPRSQQVLSDSGDVLRGPRPAASEQARYARQRAEEFAGASPHEGLTLEVIREISRKKYQGAPRMSAELGDKTPDFVNWLWENFPKDAAVRYGHRNVWPTVLHQFWSGNEDDVRTPPAVSFAKAQARADHPQPAQPSPDAPRMYTFEEVQAMLAQAKAAPGAPKRARTAKQLANDARLAAKRTARLSPEAAQ